MGGEEEDGGERGEDCLRAAKMGEMMYIAARTSKMVGSLESFASRFWVKPRSEREILKGPMESCWLRIVDKSMAAGKSQCLGEYLTAQTKNAG